MFIKHHLGTIKYLAREFQVVKNIIGHEKDGLGLLDAYSVKHKIKEDIEFITTDEEHILSNASKIEKTPTGGIYIWN